MASEVEMSLPGLVPGTVAPNTPGERARVLLMLRRRGLEGELAQMLEITPPPSRTGAVCSRGHDQDEHGRRTTRGARYCEACRVERRRMAGVLTDPTGSRRRVQHLLLNGWRAKEISGMTGYQVANVKLLAQGVSGRIAMDVADRIRVAFEERGQVVRRDVGGLYAGRGWVHVEAYADVDDPACVPSVGILGAAS